MSCGNCDKFPIGNTNNIILNPPRESVNTSGKHFHATENFLRFYKYGDVQVCDECVEKLTQQKLITRKLN